jgi:hypothetical protein
MKSSIPAQAGIHFADRTTAPSMDPGLRRDQRLS